MTAWHDVQAIRYAAGLIDENGTGRRARAMYCPRCHAVCITGLDGDRCAITAVCDPSPLDAAGELVALLAGRRTYRLRWAGRYELDPRTAIEIAAVHPGEQLDDDTFVEVLAAHRCGTSPDGAAQGVVPRDRAARRRAEQPVDPPY